MATGKRSSGNLTTRSSLVRRIKDLDDKESWEQFYRTYKPLIYGTARKRGLTDAEAEDAFQETMALAAKFIQRFDYDPSRSFRAWLLQFARWRIAEQHRIRLPAGQSDRRESDHTTRTKTTDRIPAPSGEGFEAEWDQEDLERLLDSALQHVREKVDSLHYQIFDACAIKRWPVEEVAATFSQSKDNVYKVKSRIVGLLRKEVTRLQGVGA